MSPAANLRYASPPPQERFPVRGPSPGPPVVRGFSAAGSAARAGDRNLAVCGRLAWQRFGGNAKIAESNREAEPETTRVLMRTV